MEDNFEVKAEEEVGLSGLDEASNDKTAEESASETIAGLAPEGQKRFLGEDEFWNPGSTSDFMSLSSMDVRHEGKSKEMLPQKETTSHISKQAKVRGKKDWQKGDPGVWASSMPGKRSNTIKNPPQGENHQDQTFESAAITSSNQELVRDSLRPRNGSGKQMQKKPLNHTQQRRSFTFEHNFHSKGSKYEKPRYYDLQLAREALSYTLTTPLPQTVNYSYKKKPRRPKSYSQKSNHKTRNSYGYQIPHTASDHYPPLSYAQPSHQCKTKVGSIF